MTNELYQKGVIEREVRRAIRNSKSGESIHNWGLEYWKQQAQMHGIDFAAMSAEEEKTTGSVAADLKQSMTEEQSAASAYRERARRADKKTALLYEHIAGEENTHYNEFKERLGEV